MTGPACASLPARLVATCRVVCLVALFTLPQVAAADGETLRDVVFSDYGKYSANRELVRRQLSP